ncbi:uncharacterized protein V2V93DRAFT_246392 [Kockiozyma suomiensis]|uniref:uncharacterized protein n=1 Tax=Kockiozyma suomiensis TaxID=1337062 RepID=UPI00334377F0
MTLLKFIVNSKNRCRHPNHKISNNRLGKARLRRRFMAHFTSPEAYNLSFVFGKKKEPDVCLADVNLENNRKIVDTNHCLRCESGRDENRYALYDEYQGPQYLMRGTTFTVSENFCQPQELNSDNSPVSGVSGSDNRSSATQTSPPTSPEHFENVVSSSQSSVASPYNGMSCDHIYNSNAASVSFDSVNHLRPARSLRLDTQILSTDSSKFEQQFPFLGLNNSRTRLIADELDYLDGGFQKPEYDADDESEGEMLSPYSPIFEETMATAREYPTVKSYRQRLYNMLDESSDDDRQYTYKQKFGLKTIKARDSTPWFQTEEASQLALDNKRKVAIAEKKKANKFARGSGSQWSSGEEGDISSQQENTIADVSADTSTDMHLRGKLMRYPSTARTGNEPDTCGKEGTKQEMFESIDLSAPSSSSSSSSTARQNYRLGASHYEEARFEQTNKSSTFSSKKKKIDISDFFTKLFSSKTPAP